MLPTVNETTDLLGVCMSLPYRERKLVDRHSVKLTGVVSRDRIEVGIPYPVFGTGADFERQ